MVNDSTWLDGALYPDAQIPDRLETLADQVDFLARLCGAWDFGLLPGADTIAEIRGEDWRPAVDACRLGQTGAGAFTNDLQTARQADCTVIVSDHSYFAVHIKIEAEQYCC